MWFDIKTMILVAVALAVSAVIGYMFGKESAYFDVARTLTECLPEDMLGDMRHKFDEYRRLHRAERD